MLAQALTTTTCRGIIKYLLEQRSWTTRRIARTLKAPPEYVERIHAGHQSFQLTDVEALARACRISAPQLVFQSMRQEKLAPRMQELVDLVQKELRRHDEFRRALVRTTQKKRNRTRAA